MDIEKIGELLGLSDEQIVVSKAGVILGAIVACASELAFLVESGKDQEVQNAWAEIQKSLLPEEKEFAEYIETTFMSMIPLIKEPSLAISEKLKNVKIPEKRAIDHKSLLATFTGAYSTALRMKGLL